jgi:uncharacterized protein (TIGR02453 family)
MARKRYFSPRLFSFLEELRDNNDREWFNAHKDRYQDDVKQPAMELIQDFAPRLSRVSKHFVADPRRSLFRIHRDIRFSTDKHPYKTHVGIQFRHTAGKDAHAPGFYLHLEPRNTFIGVGLWRPDGKVARQIRNAIVEDTGAWRRASRGRKFTERFRLDGQSLKRPPRGYDPNHKFVSDLMRKDFVASAGLTQKAATSADLPDVLYSHFKAGAPFVKFLCGAVGASF